MTKIGIVILNYKGWKESIECLESVFKLNYSNIEVALVDNNSDDDSIEKIIGWANGEIPIINTYEFYSDILFPPVKKPVPFQLISSEEVSETSSHNHRLTIIISLKNEGYAAGNNIGMKYFLYDKSVKYIWLLNNDTIVHPEALNSLIRTVSGPEKKIGMAGSKLLLYNSPDTIQNIGNSYNKWLSYVKEYALNSKDYGQYDQDKIMDFVTGASMLISREFIEDVGFMSEKYFLYFEEVDWAIRSHKKGWIYKFSYASKVFHKVGASTGASGNKNQKSAFSDFYYFRNRILLTRKFYPYCLPTVYLSFIFSIFNRLLRNQFSRIPMIIKLIFST